MSTEKSDFLRKNLPTFTAGVSNIKDLLKKKPPESFELLLKLAKENPRKILENCRQSDYLLGIENLINNCENSIELGGLIPKLNSVVSKIKNPQLIEILQNLHKMITKRKVEISLINQSKLQERYKADEVLAAELEIGTDGMNKWKEEIKGKYKKEFPITFPSYAPEPYIKESQEEEEKIIELKTKELSDLKRALQIKMYTFVKSSNLSIEEQGEITEKINKMEFYSQKMGDRSGEKSLCLEFGITINGQTIIADSINYHSQKVKDVRIPPITKFEIQNYITGSTQEIKPFFSDNFVGEFANIYQLFEYLEKGKNFQEFGMVRGDWIADRVRNEALKNPLEINKYIELFEKIDRDSFDCRMGHENGEKITITKTDILQKIAEVKAVYNPKITIKIGNKNIYL